MLFIIITLGFIFFRAAKYFFLSLRCKFYEAMYLSWLDEGTKSRDLLLFDKQINTVLGAAQLAPTFDLNDTSHSEELKDIFCKARSYSISKLFETASPIYLIETIVLAPIKLLDYVGVRDVPIVKFIKVIWSVIHCTVAILDIYGLASGNIFPILERVYELITIMLE